jgi:hypothetical protein
MGFLFIFQAVRPIDKTRNQLEDIQIPPDLVVKSQATDIIDIILQQWLGQNQAAIAP